MITSLNPHGWRPSWASGSIARLGLLLLCLSLPAYASPDGGWDVELLDAGTVLPTQMAVMTPSDAQNLDVYLRTTEHDKDDYRAVVLVTVPLAILAVVAVVVEGAVLASKK